MFHYFGLLGIKSIDLYKIQLDMSGIQSPLAEFIVGHKTQAGTIQNSNCKLQTAVWHLFKILLHLAHLSCGTWN